MNRGVGMNIELEIIDNVIQPKYVELKNGKYIAKVSNINLRTQAQNRSQWLWFDMIAKRLNDENIPTTQILKADIEWDRKKIKAIFFDPIMSLLYSKKTTTKLNKDEYTAIINTMTKAFGQRGIELPPFPSIEIKDKK